MVGVPGEEIDPADFANMVVESIEFDPPEGTGSRVMLFNHAYAMYVDNAGAGGGNTRFWLDGPDLGEFVVGPRSSGSQFGSIRLRTSATTASAATAHLDTSGYLRRSTSSIKYKTDVKPHRLDLDALRRLRPVSFLSKPEIKEREQERARRAEAPEAGGEAAAAGAPADPELPPLRRYVGVIAEEVHELGLTEFVAYDDDGSPDGVMYDRIVLGALQLIHELEERLAEAEQRAARFDELESRLAALEKGGRRGG
jgi:hypothetical protein